MPPVSPVPVHYPTLEDAVGKTPLVALQRLGSESCRLRGNVILGKLEGNNPAGSVKDRPALSMIQRAQERGEIKPGDTLIEATSGNTGIALAMIAAIKGYAAEIVMSDAVSPERRKMIAAFGAKIILTPGEQGTDGAIKKTKELAAADPEKYYTPDQFSNNNNILAHYETTAIELWQQMKGQVDYFVAAIGTSGTLMGVGQFLKNMKPDIKIVSAEPTKGHYIQGLKNMEEAIVPAIYDRSKLDEIIMVETEAAYEMSRQIVKNEGIFVGMSAGAAMYAAIEIAKKIDKGNIVTIFPDRGEKYLSTKLFQ